MIRFSFENNVLHMENDFTERNIYFENSVPVRSMMKNKKITHKCVKHGIICIRIEQFRLVINGA